MHGSYQLSVKIQTPRTPSQLELKIWDLVDKHAYCAPLNRSPPDFEITSTITHLYSFFFFFFFSHANTSEVDLGVNQVGQCALWHIQKWVHNRYVEHMVRVKEQTGLNNTLVMSCSVHCLFSVNTNIIFTDLLFLHACL